VTVAARAKRDPLAILVHKVTPELLEALVLQERTEDPDPTVPQDPRETKASLDPLAHPELMAHLAGLDFREPRVTKVAEARKVTPAPVVRGETMESKDIWA